MAPQTGGILRGIGSAAGGLSLASLSSLASNLSFSNLFRMILNVRIHPNINSLFISNVPVMVLLWATTSYYMDFMKTRMTDLRLGNAEDVYDFIVVGGGSGGSVVANRLSAKYKTLLIEAGGDPHPLSYFPTTSLVTLNLPIIDWGFKTVPQENACLGLKGQVSQWPSGQALGGSSVQNVMMYVRGNPRDYDAWAQNIGSDDWTYRKLLPFFIKLEDYHGYGNDTTIHGRGGPLHIEKLRFSPGLEYWLEAGRELGYEIIDMNEYQRVGFAPMDVTMKKGVRYSTYVAYLRPILDRTNLTIYRYAKALKVHLDRKNVAFGVSYYRHGHTRFARATKEVILSGGAVMTPKILMNSGIGPEDHLQEVGVEPRVHNPAVGQNLQDHVFTVIGPILLNDSVSFVLDRDTNVKTIYDYFRNGSGPIVSISGIAGAAFLPSSVSKNNYPDIYLNHIGIGVHSTFGKEMDEQFNFKNNLMEKYFAPYVGRDAYFFCVNLGRVRSIGEIKLKSSDEFEYPIINPRYLHHPDDITNMIDGIRMGLSIYENSTSFQRFGAKLAPTPLPGCEHHEFRSWSYWECYVRHYTMTVYHPCCTARAGKVDDPHSVLDPELRVKGTRNLRVIDASGMPNITNANLNGPVIMFAEKGSDLILKHWERQSEPYL